MQLNALGEETKGAKNAVGEVIALDHHQSLGLLRFQWCLAGHVHRVGFVLLSSIPPSNQIGANPNLGAVHVLRVPSLATPIFPAAFWPCLRLQKHSPVLHARIRTNHQCQPWFASSCFLPWECARLFHSPLYIIINVRHNSRNKTTAQRVWLTWDVCGLLERTKYPFIHLNCQIALFDYGVIAPLDSLNDVVFERLSNNRVDHISNPCPWHTFHVSFVGQVVENIFVCPDPLQQCFCFQPLILWDVNEFYRGFGYIYKRDQEWKVLLTLLHTSDDILEEVNSARFFGRQEGTDCHVEEVVHLLLRPEFRSELNGCDWPVLLFHAENKIIKAYN